MKVLWRFYQHVFKHKALFAGFGLLWLLATALVNLQPFFLKWITQSVQSGDFGHIWKLLTYFAVTLVLGNIFRNLAQIFGDMAMLKTGTDVQMKIMQKIHDLDFAYHTNKSSGKLISLMKRGEDALEHYFEAINLELSNILFSFIIMLYAFSQLGLKYVLLAVSITILSLTLGTPILKLHLRKRKVFTDIEDHVSGVKVDNLVNFDTVKYFAKEKYEQNRLKDLLVDFYRKAMNYTYTFRYFELVIGNLVNIALLGSLVLVLVDLQKGHITLAEFVLVIAFTGTFFPRLMEVLMLLRQLTRRYTDLQQYFGILDEEVAVKDPANPQTIPVLKGGIEFKNVAFSYPDGRAVFANLSLHIKPGESVALVGYSGSGKTTAVKLLMRMYDIDHGTITIDGVDIAHMLKSDLRSIVGVVPQDPLLFNHTIKFNLAYSRPDADQVEIDQALQAVKLDSFVDSLSEKYQTVVGERGIKLSGGQRQRLAIARVLLEQPPIVLFDEATSSLDSESERAIQEAFWKLVKDPQHPKTSIIIAHRLSTIMKTDKIIVLDKGRIFEQGSHRDLLRNEKGIYKRLWELQQDGFLEEDDTMSNI